jgi:hypothetical protein
MDAIESVEASELDKKEKRKLIVALTTDNIHILSTGNTNQPFNTQTVQ